MLNSIFGNMLSWIASILDFSVDWVLKMMTFNLSFFTSNFPIIGKLYVVLQGVGIGLVIGIAAIQTYKYFTGPLSDATSNPMEIGVRAIISIALIWIGNYFLEGIVNVFSYPYQALLSTAQVDTNEGMAVMSSAADMITGFIAGAPGILLALIMVVAVGWNTIKLLLEVVERYLMVGVLVYTSPLAWSTVSSRNTQSIFQKWLSMFLGQCLLMLLNIWSVKMLISIIGYGAANTFLRFIIALAFCKVAQRFDTYLQSLGVNAAYTGGALIDDIAAVGSTVSALGSKTAGGIISGAGNKPLGEALTKNGWMGGVTYGIGHMHSAGRSEAVSSHIPSKNIGTESDIFKNAEGGVSWQDKNGNIWSAKDMNAMKAVQAGIQQGYAQYEGESSISRDDKGKYQWTDANGVQHKADSLTAMLAEQQAARAMYDNPMNKGLESDILRNPDGTYQWTDRAGNTYAANDFESMQEQQAAVRAAYMDKTGQESDIMRNADGTYQWTDKNGGVWQANSMQDMLTTRATVQQGYSTNIGGSLRNVSAASYASNLFNPNGTPKAGVTMLDGSGREVLNGGSSYETANMIANLSNPTAMGTVAGNDSISAIKADTIASNDPDVARNLMDSSVEGGIADERVVGATYDKLFGGSESDIDSVVPGLSSAVASANGELIEGSGDVCDMRMSNGEMSGNYVPVDSVGNEGAMQGFSIRTSDSYNGLSEADKSAYTAFEGAGGERYYVSTAKPIISDTNVPVNNVTGTVKSKTNRQETASNSKKK